MREQQLGDVIDDYCVKCRRLTNHAIVSLVEGTAAKVRCRTCYNDHDYRHEQIPPSKKDLKKAALFKQVLAGIGVPPGTPAATDGAAPPEPTAVPSAEPATEAAVEAVVDASPEAVDSVPAAKKTARKKSTKS